MTELLAPAGDFECAKIALFNGADAIYCACERFGARAYAKNLTIEELKALLKLAHGINKKIYVTVNTILKDDELHDCINYVNELYELGVDGLILADFAIINYVIDNLPLMEAHISTQCGVKNLEDVKFFERIGAKRVVLARENSFEEIKKIKENSLMPIEVFAHGALCVSYSGGCLMSSMLSLRSGNRGRCSQNCRREYSILKDGTTLGDKEMYLSMKDLNTFPNLSKLVDIGVDSLKLEGRMKNPDYVKMITSEYRKKIDDDSYSSDNLDKVFHRPYTKGFIFNEDKGQIVDTSKRHREGELIGSIIKKANSLTECMLDKALNVGDRIRIQDEGSMDYYYTVDIIYDKFMKEQKSNTGRSFLNIFKEFSSDAKIYKMIDSSIDLSIDNKFKKAITIEAFGSEGTPLTLKCKIDNKIYSASSTELFQKAQSKPINTETLIKQLKKLQDTSFYLKDLVNNLNGDLFMTISSINEARRNLVDVITASPEDRVIPISIKPINKIDYDIEPLKLTAFCINEDQYNALKDLGIDTIYFNNYVPYVDPKYEDINESYILAGNYGAIEQYKEKEIITDYSFNVINAKAVYDLHRLNVKYVTLSLEASLSDMKTVYTEYARYGNNPNLEITVYGRQNLMTTKYCPLRRFGECGKCNEHSYVIKDDIASFPIYHVGCITHIVNEKPLNLIDDLKEISKYSKRLRLSFTTETKDEIIDIVNQYKEKLSDLNQSTKYFNSKTDTRGYYKRNIL